jgi:hypothetical protein
MGDGVAKMETPAFMPGRTSIRGISLGLKSFERRVQGRYSECLGMTQQTDLRVDSAWHHTYTLSIDGVTFGEMLSTA